MEEVLEQGENYQDILKMSPWEFDQSPEGWRGVEKEKGILEAIDLIIQYISINKDEINRDNGNIEKFLNFHVGQLYATEGNEKNIVEAISFFEDSYMKEKDCWNAYVRATIGFLKKDRKVIEESIKEINDSKSEDKRSGNISIINNFLKVVNEDSDYNTAYNMKR